MAATVEHRAQSRTARCRPLGRLDRDGVATHAGAAFARIQYKIFFPKSFFPEMPDYAWLENHFYFPKGWVIGALMFVNLIAAHLVRFRMQARGPRPNGKYA